MKVSRLPAGAGAEIKDFDFTLPRSTNEDTVLSDLLDEHGMLIIRNQKLTKQQLYHAGAPFGGTMTDIAAVTFDPEVVGVKVISTRGPRGDVIPDANVTVGDIDWHTDQGYTTTPNRASVLYAVTVPEEGGLTGFIDGRATYEALSDDIKEKIEDLHIIQSWNKTESYLARNRDYRIDGHKQMAFDKFPDLAYPIVIKHPRTGLRSLNVPPLWAAGIVEMPNPAGEKLLDDLKKHTLRPEFQYWHSYTPGDFVIWDNWRYLHAAGGTPGRCVRVLWTIAIHGGPEIGRILPRAS